MRVTHGMISDTMLRNLSQNLARLDKLQDQITSGKRVSRPSEDPIAVAVVLRLDSVSEQMQQYVRNVEDARSWLDATDQALDTVGQALHRARELTLSAANGIYSNDDRNAMAQELRALLDHVVGTANFSFAGQYIFSGQMTRTPAFDGTVDPPVFQGDSNPIVRMIDVGVNIPVNVTGGTTIQPALNALSTIHAAVVSGDQDAMRAGLADLDEAHSGLLAAQAQVGARVNRLDAQRERLLDIQTNVARLRSEEQDIDMAEAMSAYSTQEVIYRAALQAGSRAIQPSLMDYLR